MSYIPMLQVSFKPSFRELDPIVLSEKLNVRLLFYPFIIEQGEGVNLRGHLLYQKKGKNEQWEDYKDIELKRLKVGEYIKMELNSGAILSLLENAEAIKNFYNENGFTYEDVSIIKDSDIDKIKGILGNSDKESVVKLITENNLLPDDILSGIEYNKRKKSLEDFEEMLKGNLLEKKWQDWFENKDNSWILGTNFIDVLDERRIDIENIADFLMKSYDGFLDIVEIKRPEGGLNFWSTTQDHGNLIPHQDLIKAITQSLNYLYEIERESNSQKFSERVGGVKVVKPRITLIFGRSNTWGENEKRAYRILNSSYHNLSIITFDHVLERAKMILKNEKKNNDIDNIPF